SCLRSSRSPVGPISTWSPTAGPCACRPGLKDCGYACTCRSSIDSTPTRFTRCLGMASCEWSINSTSANKAGRDEGRHADHLVGVRPSLAGGSVQPPVVVESGPTETLLRRLVTRQPGIDCDVVRAARDSP